jgi:hypothetical protein
LKFLEKLDERGITLSDIKPGDREFMVSRRDTMPLEVRISVVGPNVGQLLIVSPKLEGRSIGLVGAEAKDIVQSFEQTWVFEQRQILSCDSTIRDLYDTSAEHAFKEIWENRLRQPSQGLGVFGRPVLGGGLRFVIPPSDSEPQIEIKIESFLRNTKKLFLETQFSWPNPQPPGAKMDPESTLTTVDNYIQNEVARFVMEE